MDRKKALTTPVRHLDEAPLSARIADHVTNKIGTVSFLLVQLAFFIVWMAFNTLTLLGVFHFDPFPFILLNLVVGIESACTGPLVMISQNRQEAKDRLMAESTFEDAELLKKNHALIVEELQDIKELLQRRG